jgi:hypothetical protein
MARRGHGEGTIERLPSGSYRATLPGRKTAGRSATFKTRPEAVGWLHEHARPTAPKPAADSGSVGDWLAKWLALTKPDASPATYADDARPPEERGTRAKLRFYADEVPVYLSEGRAGLRRYRRELGRC